MTPEEVKKRLDEIGLRLPASELGEFARLVADMREAAAVARQPLTYEAEPAATFSLPAEPLDR